MAGLTERRRELLTWFTAQMRAKLEARQDKGDHWREVGIFLLTELLATKSVWDPHVNRGSEIGELTDAIAAGDWPNVIKEAADVANYAAMIADVARGMMEARDEIQ